MQVLSPVQRYEVLAFIIDSEQTSQNLRIVMENQAKHLTSNVTVYGVEVDAEDFTIPEQRYESIMSMPAVDFQNCTLLS